MALTHRTYRLSTITLNTWNCQGDYRRRLAVMTHGLAALNPDIVLLQEVFSDRSGHENTAKSLAAALGLHCAFHPARAKIRRLSGEPIQCFSGHAILSRHPIAWSERYVLPSDPRDGERIVQFAEIDIERTRLLAVNLHLSHLEFADNLRRQQLDSIIERMSETCTHDHVLLGGDFNATFDTALFEAFSDRQTLVTQRAPASPDIGQGIDHLFAIQRRNARPLLMSAANPILHEPGEDGVMASDHVGVQAWLTLSASEVSHAADHEKAIPQ